MRLEKKEQEELAERKGLTGRTIIQVIWLIISFGIAYVLVDFLEGKMFSYQQIERAISIPYDIPELVIQGALMLLVVILMQFILFIAFAFASPEGRRRTGDASLYSRRKDPFDDGY